MKFCKRGRGRGDAEELLGWGDLAERVGMAESGGESGGVMLHREVRVRMLGKMDR